MRSTDCWVSAGPGLTQLARMPYGAHSTAIAFDNAMRPALATAYEVKPRPWPSELIDEVNRITPPPVSFIALAARWASTK